MLWNLRLRLDRRSRRPSIGRSWEIVVLSGVSTILSHRILYLAFALGLGVGLVWCRDDGAVVTVCAVWADGPLRLLAALSMALLHWNIYRAIVTKLVLYIPHGHAITHKLWLLFISNKLPIHQCWFGPNNPSNVDFLWMCSKQLPSWTLYAMIEM